MSRAVMQQALEALIPLANAASPNERECLTDEDHERAAEALEALCAALAESEQEPVAWMYDFLNPSNREEVIRNWVTQNPDDIEREKGFNVRPLYTAPTPNTLEESNGKD